MVAIFQNFRTCDSRNGGHPSTTNTCKHISEHVSAHQPTTNKIKQFETRNQQRCTDAPKKGKNIIIILFVIVNTYFSQNYYVIYGLYPAIIIVTRLDILLFLCKCKTAGCKTICQTCVTTNVVRTVVKN